MSNPSHTTSKKEVGSISDFKRSKKIAGILSIICLAGFITAIYFTVPIFFSYFWLVIPFALTILFAKSYGSWEAYTKMREQTDTMQEELDYLNWEASQLQMKRDNAKKDTHV